MSEDLKMSSRGIALASTRDTVCRTSFSFHVMLLSMRSDTQRFDMPSLLGTDWIQLS